VPEQLEAWAVGALDGDEPRGGGAEHELEHLSTLASHLQAPSLLMHREHRAPLGAAAEVQDARLGTYAGDRS
jgi:hypothetical protein